MDAALAVLVFLAVVAAVLITGVRIGMIVAPRLGAWVDRHEEPPNDDD